MDAKFLELLKKPMIEWTAKDNALYEKHRNKKYDLKNLLQMSQDEWSEKDIQNFETIKRSLPKNVVKLPKDEAMISPGQNAKPFTYTVEEGDTLKSISEDFGISYGELSIYLLSNEGSTSIHTGDIIVVPRHFVDLSRT